jgi:hypothetical protein
MPKPPKLIEPLEPPQPIEFLISNHHYNAHILRKENCLLFAQPNVVLKAGAAIVMSNEGLVKSKNLKVREIKRVKIHLHTDLVWVWINERNLHQDEVIAFAKKLGYSSKVNLAQAYVDSNDAINFEWKGRLLFF